MSGKIYSPANTLASHNGNNSNDNPQVNDGDGFTVRYRITPLSSPLVVERRKRAEAEAPREMPRGKRERIHRYYSKVLSMTLAALYDGKPKRFPGRDYIEYVISALGYDQPDEWLYITDDDLIRANTAAVRIHDDAFIAREIDRIQKQRERTNAAQSDEGNPILIEFEAEYDHELKVNRARYKRPICELLRDIIADCPVGTPDKRLRVAVIRKAAEYLERFAGSAKTTKRKREHSADSDASRAATFALGAFKKQADKSDAADAALLIRNAFMAKFGELYTQVFSTYVENAENEKSDVANKGVNPETCTTIVPRVEAPETGGLCSIKNIKPVPQSGASKPPLLGVSMEQFMAELEPGNPAPPDPEALPKPGPTPRMRELIQRVGHIVPESFSEASTLIGELIAKGAFSNFFSLEELELFDPKAGGHHRTERRFCCPDCGLDKPMDDEHRSLSLNTSSGAYYCHRCQASGVIREHLGDSSAARRFTHTEPAPEPKPDKWREWWAKAKPVRGTPGQTYLEGRGVPIEAAEAAGVRYGQWWKRGASGPESFNAVLFPVLDADGQLVAVIARGIVGKVMRTGGDLKLGVFRATLDATSANRIAITESPIDALVLAAVGLDAVGTGGTHWAEWLPDALQDIDVALAQDADKAGDECATKLSSLLPTSWRLRPVGAKDFSEMAELAGLDAVAEMVMDAQSRAPEVQV